MLTRAPDNSALAARLASAGVATFPCQSEGEFCKRPVKGVLWRRQATDNPAQVAAWWRGFPHALPAHALGKTGLFVVDVDCHDGGPDGVGAWGKLIAEHGEPDAPKVTTPSGGTHYYFRQPEGSPLGNNEGALPKGINIRGAGGYVIAPGAVLPDGAQYSELDGYGLNAPPPPQWLLDLIRAPKQRAAIAPPPPDWKPVNISLSASGNRLRAYVDAAVNAEIARIHGVTPGAWNNTLNEAAFSVGTLVGSGWLSESEAFNLLLSASLAVRPDKRAEAEGTIRSGLNSGKLSPRPEPEGRNAFDSTRGAEIAAALIDGVRCNPETGEIVEDDEPGEIEPAPLLSDWLYPAGLLGEIADWIIETTPRRPNRPLAVAAAMVIVGTALSRTLAGPTRSGTHLYIACIGGTGIGKDWPQRAIAMIMEAAGLSMAVSSGKWKSDVALENGISDNPAQIAVIDEIGQNLFMPIMGRRAGSHQAGISGVLRQLWSASFASYQTSASAARRTQTVRSPALSIYGASTVDEFYESLTGDAAENGFLNRFLLVKAAPRAKPKRRAPTEITVPQSIIDGVRGLLPQGGNMAGGEMALCMSQAPEFKVMEWAGSDVSEAYESFDEMLIDKADEDGDCAKFLGRTAEMSIRLATIHAASRGGRDAVLAMSDLEWGQAVALASADIMMLDVRSRMADNDAQARHKLVERLIREGQPKDGSGFKRRDLLRKVAGKIPEREVDAILSALAGAETIAAIEHKPEGGGRPSLRYLYLERK